MIPFSWDYVYRFAPYTSEEDMEKEMGVKSRYLKEVKSDDMFSVYVVKDNKIVAYVNEKGNQSVISQIPEKVKNGENADVCHITKCVINYPI